MGADEVGALLAELRDDLGFRRIEQGIRRLERIRSMAETLRPEMVNSGVLVGLLAQWVDAGFDNPQLLCRLLARFPQATRSALTLLDYLHLRMAEGALAMSQEDFEGAASHFRFVQSLEEAVADPELLAIANFWTGRCLRKTGRYDDALAYIERGEALALSCGYPQMAAIMQATRSWLAFQKGRLTEAVAILRHAETALNRTDDYLSRGNVQSAYGRIARRQGRYERALECLERAIAEYRSGDGAQLQVARALLNLAFVKRLLALHCQKDVDHILAARRSAREDSTGNDRVRELRLRIDRIRNEAHDELAESLAIYEPRHNHRGIAGVHINRGYLCLDSGDLECAAVEAAEAFRHGEEKIDYIVMARARILECIVENAAFEEQLGDPAHHHETAEAFARDAVAFAGHTQNRRLLARAYTWQGLTDAIEPYGDLEAARRCCEQAIALLQPEGPDRQYVWEDLESLKSKVLHTRPVDPMLRAWAAGVVEDKTFSQLTEEFARIVIPKVWEREGRKISRVAEKLSISPKKVRRILHSAGLHATPVSHPADAPTEPGALRT
ncbi:MAG TPA: tetratricopeptide repeat protein [Bryobacteraceae bacterium]|nr:tetratricopeptide repeat protein [Bryobacteraceae bacterium]